MKLEELKNQFLKSKRFRDEYYKKNEQQLASEIGLHIIEARIAKGLTQEKLAKLMKTKQPSIARAEGGSMLPSLSFLQKMAEKLNTYLIPPKFAFLEYSLENATATNTNTASSITFEELISDVSSFKINDSNNTSIIA